MVCDNFILPEPASYVFFYAIFNLRKLFYLINRRRSNGSLTSNLYRLTKHKTSQPPAKGGL